MAMTPSVLNNLSVIVPFTAGDIFWKDLLQDLKALPMGAEILLVGPDALPAEMLKRASEHVIAPIHYVHAPKGRALQMNAGAKAATKDYFWFLHADNKVPRPAIFALEKGLLEHAHALHYFNLQYLDDGPPLVRLNALATNWRSRFFQLPFGDQGFAMSRTTFYRLGGFSVQSAKGEDHLLIWQARRKRVPLHHLPASLFTSARAYAKHGWGRLSGYRIYITAKQALLEGFKLGQYRVVEKLTRRRLRGVL